MESGPIYRSRKSGLAKSISRADTLLSFLTYSRLTITMSLLMYSERPLCNVYAEGAVSLKAIQLSAMRWQMRCHRTSLRQTNCSKVRFEVITISLRSS